MKWHVNMKVESINPATLERNGTVEADSPEEVREKFKQAREARDKWQKMPLKHRARVVAGTIEVIVDQMDEISRLIIKEVDKLLFESFMVEVYTAIDATFYCYNNVERFIGGKKEIPLSR